jgi:hypothetical protein
MVLALAAGMTVGCDLFRRSPAADPDGLPPTTPGPPNTVELTVHILSGPSAAAAETFATNYWNRATETLAPTTQPAERRGGVRGPLAPDVDALWRANGLRVGLGGREVLAAVAPVRETGTASSRSPSPLPAVARFTRRFRVVPRGETLLAMSEPAPNDTFLFTLSGRQALVRSFQGASVTLRAQCRLVDEATTYVTLVPGVAQTGRDPEETGLLDFLATEVALTPESALLVGVGSPDAHTVGQRLLTSAAASERVERLLILTARPVHVDR